VAGTAARLYRLSFSGELAYESVSRPIWRERLGAASLCRRGAVRGGSLRHRALGVMRIEKGHPAGNELNGTTTAADLGLGG
jgi:sarcosine oxidase subunit alpha